MDNNNNINIDQAMNGLTLWHGEISSFDNNVRDETDNLRIVCLNLQMEGSRYQIPTIEPIAKNLAATIVKLNTQCNLLINKGRKELGEFTKFIFDYIKECQKEIQLLKTEINSSYERNELLAKENAELKKEIEELKNRQ